MPTLTLKNPHSVLEALRFRPHDVLEVRVSRTGASGAWQTVAQAAREVHVPLKTVNPPERVEAGFRGAGRTAAAEAVVRERAPVDIRDLFADAATAARGVWLALDQLQDPQNVGAIFRTAAFFGIRGILLTRHKSAPLTAAAYDVASGGVEHVPFALVANLAQGLALAKETGLWVLGTSEHAPKSIWEVDRDRNWMVVLGNEEAGLRRLTAETCDELYRIPSAGGVGSLNVSVAAGVVLAALTGRRGKE